MQFLLLPCVASFFVSPPLADFVMIPNALENGTWTAMSLPIPQKYTAFLPASIPANAVVGLQVQCDQCHLFGMSVSVCDQDLPLFVGELDHCDLVCIVNRTFDSSGSLTLTVYSPGNEQGWLKVFQVQIEAQDTTHALRDAFIVTGVLFVLFIMAVLIYKGIGLKPKSQTLIRNA